MSFGLKICQWKKRFMMKFSFFKQFDISQINTLEEQERHKKGRNELYLKDFLLDLVCKGLDCNKNVIQSFNGYKT